MGCEGSYRMTRRQISRLPDPEHRRLMYALHAAPKGQKLIREKAVRMYVGKVLGASSLRSSGRTLANRSAQQEMAL